MKNNYGKQDLLDALLLTVQLTRGGSDVQQLSLINDEIVSIRYKSGGEQYVNIACDSGMAIIRDVCRAIG